MVARRGFQAIKLVQRTAQAIVMHNVLETSNSSTARRMSRDGMQAQAILDLAARKWISGKLTALLLPILRILVMSTLQLHAQGAAAQVLAMQLVAILTPGAWVTIHSTDQV